MNETVVVGYDGSEESRTAIAYASRRVNGGRLFIVSSAKHPPEFLGKPHYQHLLDAAQSRTRELLEEAAGQVPDGVEFETEMLDGPPADAIVKVADARDADVIVIGSRGLGRVHALLGSVSHDVLHLAGMPVVVIPAKRGE
jgi:nucleotide-binding universal stress UspA family protein